MDAQKSQQTQTSKGVDPKQVPVIVMYSVGKAEEMIRNSEYEKAKKMMESTAQLCERYGAPVSYTHLKLPTIRSV